MFKCENDWNSSRLSLASISIFCQFFLLRKKSKKYYLNINWNTTSFIYIIYILSLWLYEESKKESAIFILFVYIVFLYLFPLFGHSYKQFLFKFPRFFKLFMSFFFVFFSYLYIYVSIYVYMLFVLFCTIMSYIIMFSFQVNLYL